MASSSDSALFERADYSLQVSSLVLLYYDYILTLPAEVKYVWKTPEWTRPRMTTLFYIFCRYALVANLLYLVLKTEGAEIEVCQVVKSVSGVLGIFGHVGVLAVWGLRTLAICNGNKIVAGVLGAVGGATIILRIAVEPFNRCPNADVSPGYVVGMASGASLIVFEGIAFLLAAVRAWRTVRQDPKFWETPTASLNYVIFSQAMLCLSILAAALNLKVWNDVVRPLNSLKLPLPALLTARFLLKLRMWDRHAVDSTNNHHHVSTFKARSGLHFRGQGVTTAGSENSDEFEEDDSRLGTNTRQALDVIVTTSWHHSILTTSSNMASR
ncbi:hypothetical protein FA15DRAFT_669253 [Coprinopsis marcescibilis]|uniref:DUF6533 domain-containing protein n=1 Tax=Coprinopsis marcescibilis TaxID=230819 RepID=A0A5C3KWY7_COPMA|nr:hypothetical protein FA15DRAFT_669253 [Coprinopsis marcescibilis]